MQPSSRYDDQVGLILSSAERLGDYPAFAYFRGFHMADGIAAPYRWRIRHKIKCLRGKGIVIPGVGLIVRDETILDYRARTGEIASDESEYTVSVRGITEITSCPMDPKSNTAYRDDVLPLYKVDFTLKPLNVMMFAG